MTARMPQHAESVEGGARCTVIAEAGVNHNGSPARALKMVDVAAACGADAVKFQMFHADRLVTAKAAKAGYQKSATGGGNQLSMLRRLELPRTAYDRLKERCAARGIEMIVTPFDVSEVEVLAHDLRLARLKLPSGDVNNAQLLYAAARTKRPVILSTGMSTMAEVGNALDVLAFGYAGKGRPTRAAVRGFRNSRAGRAALGSKVTLLHCTTEYPAPFADANLAAMATMQARFGLAVGLSDHTLGIAIPTAAVARGATIIEKHFTLSRRLPGPDHKASLEPLELKAMVEAIRAVEQAIGDGKKAPRPSERKNIRIARRSVVAARRIAKGERFTEDAIAAKRPAGGLDPMKFWDLIGRRASRSYAPDQAIAADEVP
jgi:N-acetylneuraminate synthase